MTWLDRLHHPEKYAVMFLKWGGLGILMGFSGGAIGSGFHYVLHFVTHLRSEHGWLIWLLPLGGLLTVGMYRLFGLRNNRGTNEIIDAILENNRVSAWIAPAIFLSTTTTHLLGGSAGREGAALQLGGGVASWTARVLKLNENDRTVLIMSGMSAVFGGLLGLDAGIAAAAGLVGLFCCVTNAPLAAIVLSIEMFGTSNLYLLGMVCVICFLLSGNSSLYSSQKLQFSKTEMK